MVDVTSKVSHLLAREPPLFMLVRRDQPHNSCPLWAPIPDGNDRPHFSQDKVGVSEQKPLPGVPSRARRGGPGPRDDCSRRQRPPEVARPDVVQHAPVGVVAQKKDFSLKSKEQGSTGN